MKKNLKKVISAVVAFALTASSAAFAAAPSFTDVADTASYADSVKTLTALGVISGYEDGTFKPDDKITRAEVSTMIVAAINRTADAKGQMGNTKFADMNNEAKKWASGYVNVAVSEDIIAGFEDGTFRPDEQVTYVQVVKMLVCAAGYGQYASYLGGWPNGYLSVASDKGITVGVSAGQDEAVTRAQVAQLIYNTLDVPMVASSGFSISETTGAVVPSLKIMDGKGTGSDKRDYQTLLTQKHNAYKVEGMVKETNRTNSSKYDANEVSFEIQYTENYDDSDIVIPKNSKSSDYRSVDVYVGDTAAADYLNTYATAIIKIDENDDATFVSFVPSGKNKVDEFDATLIDDEDYNLDATAGRPYLKFFSSQSASKSSKYSLESSLDDVTLYVNGVEMTKGTKADNIKKYVVENKTGKIQLMDTYKADEKTNGYYDTIFVTYYATAKVDSVNTSNKKIFFANSTTGKNNISLDTDANEDLSYSITLNGEAIELAAIQKDDILSIAYDVTDFANSGFYEIHVSRDKVEGQYTTKDTEDETVTVGGTAYEFVYAESEKFADKTKKMEISNQYTLYLDAFGRIYEYETLADSKKYAIIDKYTKSSSDDYYKATLFTSDGAVKAVQVNKDKVKSKGFNGNTTDVDQAILDYVYSDVSKGIKNDIKDRVVTYKIAASTGYIIEMTALTPGAQSDNKTDTFRSRNNTVGSVKMSAATKVVDAIDYLDASTPSTNDLKTSSLTAFVDDNKYTTFAYGEKDNDNAYPFVIVTAGAGTYNTETMLAVLTKAPQESTDDTYVIEALYGKEKKSLDTTDEVEVYAGSAITMGTLAKGDVVAFSIDGAGKIKRIDRIVAAADLGIENGKPDDVKAAAQGAADKADFTKSVINKIKVPTVADNWTNEWTKNSTVTGFTNVDANDVSHLVFGPIVDKSSNSFVLGTYSDTLTTDIYKSIENIGDSITDAKGRGLSWDIGLASDARIYVCDFSASRSENRYYIGTAGSAAKTIFASDMYSDANQTIVDWSKVKTSDTDVNYAFAKVVNGVATDVYVILTATK